MKKLKSKSEQKINDLKLSPISNLQLTQIKGGGDGDIVIVDDVVL